MKEGGDKNLLWPITGRFQFHKEHYYDIILDMYFSATQTMYLLMFMSVYDALILERMLSCSVMQVLLCYFETSVNL